MLHRLAVVFACLALIVGISPLLSAQEVTANILGTVTDASGSVVPNAKVTVTSRERNQTVRSPTTNDSGIYAATLLPLGTYSVAVEAKGFKKSVETGIELGANEKRTADFKLEVGDVSVEVTVQASVTQVEL